MNFDQYLSEDIDTTAPRKWVMVDDVDSYMTKGETDWFKKQLVYNIGDGLFFLIKRMKRTMGYSFRIGKKDNNMTIWNKIIPGDHKKVAEMIRLFLNNVKDDVWVADMEQFIGPELARRNKEIKNYHFYSMPTAAQIAELDNEGILTPKDDSSYGII